jgi:hypothetical protein
MFKIKFAEIRGKNLRVYISRGDDKLERFFERVYTYLKRKELYKVSIEGRNYYFKKNGEKLFPVSI